MPRGTIAVAAIASAVEQALWDLAGRSSQRDVTSLLGADHARSIALYANINRRTLDRSPEGVAASAREAAAAGFTRFKFAPFDDLVPADEGSPHGRDKFEAGIARMTAMREALGPGADIYVDCHWRFGIAGARRAIDALAALGVTWFECPLPEEERAIPDIVALRAHANANGMRLAGLEAMTSREAFAPWLAAGAYDVVMPDVKYCGGIEELIAIGGDALAHRAACAPHNPSGPVSHAASLVACAHLPPPVLLEHQWDETPRFHELAGPGLPMPAGGASALPDGPGLGSGPAPRT
jgi:galactonate dehydratase